MNDGTVDRGGTLTQCLTNLSPSNMKWPIQADSGPLQTFFSSLRTSSLSVYCTVIVLGIMGVGDRNRSFPNRPQLAGKSRLDTSYPHCGPSVCSFQSRLDTSYHHCGPSVCSLLD
ncbi:hypothetical protein ElyMa_001543900 [Elysia marginata]|uniref:Uncharacterized protein n=1 Tax=Elysia marginata TaxID=1093978 RepID=A0AAV4J9M8_9GAST|nr:hypothetical protein ElyMa_001543900 [Elysia marginata]